MTLLAIVILAALVFEFINGFHDTANSIAAVVGTRVLSPGQAIVLAACMNLCGALVGVAVATTVGKGLVEADSITNVTLLCALVAASVWNIFTWRLGLPSSSSHALFGGLIGASVASAGWAVVIWAAPVAGKPWFASGGVFYKVILPMFTSPLLGLCLGFTLLKIFHAVLRDCTRSSVSRVFRKLQIFSAAFMGFSHGSNDAQKTMGILALALYSWTQANGTANLPECLSFLRTPEFKIALWVKIVCSLTMATGTAAGGRRIIRTLGRKVARLSPTSGFTADLTSATVLMTTARMGMPVSTTHVVSASITGVGAARNIASTRWQVVESIAWTWVFTLPVSGLLGFLLMRLLRALGLG
jgi:inorganic phosphate transporter, PiT family